MRFNRPLAALRLAAFDLLLFFVAFVGVGVLAGVAVKSSADAFSPELLSFEILPVLICRSRRVKSNFVRCAFLRLREHLVIEALCTVESLYAASIRS